jgi:hypothetical protein
MSENRDRASGKWDEQSKNSVRHSASQTRDEATGKEERARRLSRASAPCQDKTFFGLWPLAFARDSTLNDEAQAEPDMQRPEYKNPSPVNGKHPLRFQQHLNSLNLRQLGCQLNR